MHRNRTVKKVDAIFVGRLFGTLRPAQCLTPLANSSALCIVREPVPIIPSTRSTVGAITGHVNPPQLYAVKHT